MVRLKKTFVIVNPASGIFKPSNISIQIRDAFQKAGIEFDIMFTRKSIGASALSRSVDEDVYDTVVAAGGDGTINEVVNGLFGKKVRFGIIPVGTMNVLARELHIPLNIQKAVDIIKKGRTRVIDAAMADERVFLLMAGIGFDAYAIYKADLGWKKYLGPLAYVLAGLYSFLHRRPQKLKVVLDHGKKKDEGYFVLVSNVVYYGGSFPVVPDARLDDGWLDVMVFTSTNFQLLFRFFTALLTGHQKEFPYIHYHKARTLNVSSEHNVLVHTDAELAGTLPMDFKILPKAFRVVVP